MQNPSLLQSHKCKTMNVTNIIYDLFCSCSSSSDNDVVEDINENGVEVYDNDYSVQTEIPSSIVNGPVTGMLFSDIGSLYQCYQAHAKHRGFSISKRKIKKYGEKHKYALMVCHRSRHTTA